MKRFLAPSLWRGGALALLALSALAALPAHAGITPSGTTISNTATLNYSVGGVGQTAIGSSLGGNTSGAGTPTSCVVDKMINVKVITMDLAAVPAVPAQTGVTTTFKVTNTGNSTQDFYLVAGNVATGETVLSVTDGIDVSGSCTIDAGSGATWIASLAQDDFRTVSVFCTMPSTAVNSNVALVYLRATAKVAGSITALAPAGTLVSESGTNSPTTADVVFADAKGSDDNLRDAAFSARSAYQINTASLKITKTVTALCDPYNGTTNASQVPGAFVQYTVTITNSGTAGASATLTQISDALSTNVTFDNDLIVPTGASDCKVPATGSAMGVKIAQGNRGGGYPKLLTTTNTDTDGAYLNAGVSGVSSNEMVINYAEALPAGELSHAAGELKVGESVTVTYQVQVN
jgi:uncharacterized repeat protein (TIGR01451 family)